MLIMVLKQSQLNKIYKVNYIINGKIDTIYVFSGKNIITNKEDLFKKIFNETEIANINLNKIKIKFSEQQIYFDDNIGTIKIKILQSKR